MDLLAKANTFVRVVEAGSFSGAARSLRQSLAAISRQMKTLERELGASLVVRTTRSLRLTEEGRRFHEHALRLVREAEAARASVRRGNQIAGHVLVSSSVTLGVRVLVPVLPALLEAHPALSVELRLEDHAVDLVSEGVDIAVRAGLDLPDTTSLVAVPLARFERHLVASPAYLRKRGRPRSVASLASHAAVVGPRSRGTWSFVEGGEPRTVHVESRMQVGTLLGLRAAALAGGGVAVLPDFVVADDLESGALVRLLPQASLAPVMAHALYRIEMRGVPRVQTVLAHLEKSRLLGLGRPRSRAE
jgi:DNA-binding transcriptional LysR family regulator